jgi:hypothetical protein
MSLAFWSFISSNDKLQLATNSSGGIAASWNTVSPIVWPLMSGKYPKMASFNGSMKLKICEAVDLKPTDCATRLQMGVAKAVQLIDPYISIDIDDIHFARTSTKPKTLKEKKLE